MADNGDSGQLLLSDLLKGLICIVGRSRIFAELFVDAMTQEFLHSVATAKSWMRNLQLLLDTAKLLDEMLQPGDECIDPSELSSYRPFVERFGSAVGSAIMCLDAASADAEVERELEIARHHLIEAREQLAEFQTSVLRDLGQPVTGIDAENTVAQRLIQEAARKLEQRMNKRYVLQRLEFEDAKRYFQGAIARLQRLGEAQTPEAGQEARHQVFFCCEWSRRLFFFTYFIY